MTIRRQMSQGSSRVTYLIPGINGRARCLGGDGQVHGDYPSLSRALRRHRNKKTRADAQGHDDHRRRRRDASGDILRLSQYDSPHPDSSISLSYIRELLVAQESFENLSGMQPYSHSDHGEMGDYGKAPRQNYHQEHHQEDPEVQVGANEVDNLGSRVSQIRHADLVFLTKALSHEVATMRRQYRAVLEAQTTMALSHSGSGGWVSSTDLVASKHDSPTTSKRRIRRTTSHSQSRWSAPQSPVLQNIKRASSSLSASAHEQRQTTNTGIRMEPSFSKVELQWNGPVECVLSRKAFASRQSPKPTKKRQS